MKARILVGLITIVVALMTTSPVYAIKYGFPDGDDHPFVGLSVYYDSNGAPMWRCSGALIAPQVYLTAGHCVESPAAHVEIWFSNNVEEDPTYPFPGDTSVGGTPYVHPQFISSLFFMHDLGVVILDEPVDMPRYGELPEEGILDVLGSNQGKHLVKITAVGYGLQKVNPVFEVAYRIRLQAELDLVNMNGTVGIPDGVSIILSNNAHTGGTCFGDSGGPEFLNDTDVIVAVTSFGINGNCAGIGGGYRVDTADDLDWIYETFGDLL